MSVGMRNYLGAGLVAALLGTSAASGHPMLAVAPASTASPAHVLLLAQTSVSALPYLWSATKGSDGTIDLDGYVPSQDVKDSLLDDIANPGTDATTLASGEPDGFVDDAVAALGVLADLDSGKAAFDGAAWSLTGTVDSADKAATAQAAFDASPLKTLGATYAVTGPDTAAAEAAKPADDTSMAASDAAKPAGDTAKPAGESKPADDTAKPAAETAKPADDTAKPATDAAASTIAPPAAPEAPPAAPQPAISPNYAWSAEKAGDGTITFNGTVPNDKLKTFLIGHAGGKTLDNSTVAAGAPESFVGGALYGLDALMALESGKLLYAGGNWSLAGIAKDAAAEKAAKAAVAVIDTKDWKFDIKAPVATAPAPAASTETPAPAKAAETPAAPAKPAETPAAPATTETPAAPAASTEAPKAAETPANPAAEPYVFGASKQDGGTIALTGQVPTEGAKGYFADMAGNATTDGVKVVPHAPDDFVIEALGGLDALGQLRDGQLGFDGKTWSLKGKAATPELRDKVLASVGALPRGDAWQTDIAGPSPLELCTASVASFATSSRINFDTKTHLAKGSAEALDLLAKDLAACPDVRVDIEGHTDSDGDASANMALSVARAEAVISELAKRGVTANRLYAVGYGETLPLVPNTTKANKAKNRRIEFKVGDDGAK